MKNRIIMTKEWQEALIDQPDFLRMMIQSAIQKALDIQFNEFIGALPYERSEKRRSIRNGTYQRQLKTRVGSIKNKWEPVFIFEKRLLKDNIQLITFLGR